MSDTIILTKEQADAVRGETSSGHFLNPVLLDDGVTWCLPAAVLSDPAHAKHLAALQAMPKRAVAREEYRWHVEALREKAERDAEREAGRT